jgi:hypothetical protein
LVSFRGLACVLVIAACGAGLPQQTAGMDDLYVDDFHSDDMLSCKPSDVPLGHAEAREFFRLAKPVTSHELHDHYELAPCYVTGPVRYHERACTFEIRAGATGTIRCGQELFQFACDTCEKLFVSRQP